MDGVGWRNQTHGLHKERLGELGLEQSRIPWFCDNHATTISARTSGFNGRTRHIDVKMKFTRQEYELGNVELL